MPVEPPDRPVTTAARVRFVLGRLLGPWAWALAAFGVFCLSFPGTAYMSAPGPVSELPPDADDGTDWSRATRARIGLTVGPAGRTDGISPGHLREITITANGPVRLPRPVGEEGRLRFDEFASDRDWKFEAAWPAWGVAVSRSFSNVGWTILSTVGPPPSFEDPGNEEAVDAYLAANRRTTSVRIGLIWLAGVPAFWSVWRAISLWIGGGNDRPGTPAWRTAARPFVAGFGTFGAALLIFGGGEYYWGPQLGDVKTSLFTRRDPLNTFHPRFIRVAFDRPLADVPEGWTDEDGEPRPPWAFGGRRWGAQADRRLGSRYLSCFGGSYDVDDPDYEERTALDLSLWYALLPAALWSGVSLWRSRAGRMRPA